MSTPGGTEKSWTAGGWLLIAAGVLGLISTTTPAVRVLVDPLGALAFAASCIVFAFGVPEGTPVTGRNRVGAWALAVFGCWQIVTSVAAWLFPQSADPTAFVVLGGLGIVVPLVAGLLATALIGIMRAVPWRWAPLAGLALVVLPNAVLPVIALVAGNADQATLVIVYLVQQLVAGIVPVLLGALAVLCARRASAPSGRPALSKPTPT